MRVVRERESVIGAGTFRNASGDQVLETTDERSAD